MKKFFIAFLAIGVLSTYAKACDICGLGTSNYNPFLFPHLSKTYVSLNYLTRQYHIHSDEGLSKEYFNTILLTGQYSIGEKIQLTALIPYQANKQENYNGTQRAKGLGDVTLLANYRLWNHQGRSNTHTVLVGAGVKLPTGVYTTAKSGTIEDQNFQLGTGSLDYLLNASYRLSYRKWIFSANTSYKYNTQNKEGYRFGDVLTNGVTAVYRKELRKFSVAPYVQIINEVQMKDANDHALQEQSGGGALYAGGGLEINTRKTAFGINYQFPASQKLAEGQIEAKSRLSARISFIF